MSATEPIVDALDHLVLTVADVEATVDFYGRVLGLRPIHYGDGRTALGFGRQKLNLHAAHELHRPVAARPVPGSADLCFRTGGPLGEALRRLRREGVPLVAGPVERTGACGPITSIYFTDLDGNLVEVGAEADRIGELEVRAATPADRADVEALLGAEDLPVAGLDDAWPRMRVARLDGRILAAAGVERWGEQGLLRSVVVHPDLRGKGVGEEMVWRVLGAARNEGIERAWLLTFVPAWFERLGFRAVERSRAPEALGASQEMQGACPDTAVLMTLPLRPEPTRPAPASASVDPRYPIGRPRIEPGLDADRRSTLIDAVGAAPARLRAALAGLDDRQLDAPYREGGWTVRQLVHHLADATANGAMRLRLALTEETPRVRTYDQVAWAELPDARTAPPEWSLDLFESTTRRIVALLRSLSSADFSRRYDHPETGAATIDAWLQIYAWHGLHHVAQIEAARAREESAALAGA